MAESPLLSVRFKESSQRKLVIIVSKKVEPTAVGRNKIRRRIKEALRKYSNVSLRTGTTTIYTKKPIAQALFKDIEHALRVALS